MREKYRSRLITSRALPLYASLRSVCCVVCCRLMGVLRVAPKNRGMGQAQEDQGLVSSSADHSQSMYGDTA